MNVLSLLLVGCGAFLGGIARYAVNILIAERWAPTLPLATFVVNITGSLAIGFLATIVGSTSTLAAELRLALIIGFLGAYTTFSTWSFETLALLESGSFAMAALNVFGSIIAGIAAAAGGVALARLLQ